MKNYLSLCYQRNRKIFFFTMVFIIANIFITFTKQNSFPIVNWGVFSTPYPKIDSYSFFVIEKNGKPLEYKLPWLHNRQLAYQFLTGFYIRAKKNQPLFAPNWNKSLSNLGFEIKSFEDSYRAAQNLDKFPTWLARFSKFDDKNRTNELKIRLLKVSYLGDQQKIISDSLILIYRK